MQKTITILEEWKTIDGYPDYRISNFGRVETKRKKNTKGWNRGLGYKKVKLYNDKGFKSFFVHRLVAIQFIPNLENKGSVNHIDSNPSNNHISNLEWCTHKENIQHAAAKGRMIGKSKKVINTQNGKIYNSVKDAAKSIDMIPNLLVCRLIGRTKNNTNFKYAS